MKKIFLVALSLMLFACSPHGPRGIGTSLSSQNHELRTSARKIYMLLICREAGLPVITEDGETGMVDNANINACDTSQFDAEKWKAFVNFGVLDIDARCDAYLTWLYNLRKNSDQVRAQIVETGLLAEGALSLAGASSKAISTLARVFSFSDRTFTNVSQGLLFSIDGTTIQKLVLARQHKAKEAIKTLQIKDKASAFHVLRGYLRICTPFSMETSINSVVNVAAELKSGTTGSDRVFADIIPPLINP